MIFTIYHQSYFRKRLLKFTSTNAKYVVIVKRIGMRNNLLLSYSQKHIL